MSKFPHSVYYMFHFLFPYKMGLSKVKGHPLHGLWTYVSQVGYNQITDYKIKKEFTKGKLLGGYYLNWY